MHITQRVRRFLLPVLIAAMLAVSANAAECDHELVYHRIESVCSAQGCEWNECALCGFICDLKLLPEVDHEFGDWYTTVEPTCSQPGVQVRDCVVCGAQEQAELPHLGHEYIVEVMPPSCTARGYTSHYCPGCGDRFRTDYTEPLGHRYDGGVITKAPTLTAMGRILYTCTGCGDTYQEMIPMLTNPFEDIDDQAYYFSPVIWAVNAGITSGIDETHFGPELQCNRAQVVTFLWRAAGKPEPGTAENPFIDVPVGCFYEQAVLWAYENGITTGTDAAHFSPAANCSRAQVVTFLHRFRGTPAPTVDFVFPDVAVDSFYHDAVLWAAQRGITVGMDGGLFRPELECSRAQIVTFLYRDEMNP